MIDDDILDPSGPQQKPPPERPSSGTARGKSADARGPILDLDDEAAAKHITQLWKRGDKAAKQLGARFKVNRKRRSGERHWMLQKSTDQNEWKAYAPPGGPYYSSGTVKSDELCRKFTGIVFADPPKPDAEPTSGSDEDRDAAEAATRVLEHETDEAQLAITRICRQAFDEGGTYGSGFVRFWPDPHAGGHVPKTITASTAAQTVEDALFVTSIDPATGQPVKTPHPQPYVERYVAQDGVTLTDEQAEALMEWAPGTCREVLDGRFVRPIPMTADDVADADGVLIACMTPLGQLKKTFPAVMRMGPGDLQALVAGVPGKLRDFLPPGVTEADARGTEPTDSDGPPDDALVFTLSCYMEQGPEYPCGAYAMVGGDRFLLHREEWCYKDDAGVTVALELPIAQFKQFRDAEFPFWGRGAMDIVGESEEAIAKVDGAIMQHLDQLLNRKTFLPMGGVVQPKDMNGPARFVYFDGRQAPVAEEIPELGSSPTDFRDRVATGMDSAMGLQEVLQGTNSPSVTSGEQATTIIQQANNNISDVHQNTAAAIERAWRIVLQLWLAFRTGPQKIRYLGDDNRYKLRELSRSDIGGTKDVKVRKGSFTMMSPSMKAQEARGWAAPGADGSPAIISPEELRRIMASNVGVKIGVQDDPVLIHVRRQIADWEEGPPEGFEQAWAQYQQQAAMVAQQNAMLQQQAAAQGVQAQPMPAPAVPTDIFLALPNDAEPTIAPVRLRELSRGMCGTKYAKQPPAWRQVYDMEYERMRAAAGVQTVAEQQAAQQQAAAQQAASVAAEKTDDRAAEEEGAEAEHARGMERDAIPPTPRATTP